DQPGRGAPDRHHHHSPDQLTTAFFSTLLVTVGLSGFVEAGPAQVGVRPLVIVDVPFLAQTEDLCGGAAAAMVLRYWGESAAQADDFASLVQKDKGGIVAADLVMAMRARGFEPRPIRAGSDTIPVEIAAGRPVIALIDAGGGRRHYVVIVAWDGGRVLFHDPAVGPFRLLPQADFQRLWTVTEDFAIVVTPGAIRRSLPETSPAPPPLSLLPRAASPCDPMIEQGIATAQGPDPEAAVPALSAAASMCATESRALNALAGIRFKQKRWSDAAAFARDASMRDATDADNWRLLGAALYLDNHPLGALSAWNHIDEPRIDRIKIDGLIRTHQDVATAALGLHPRDVLTPSRIEHAQRRLGDLPTSGGSKIVYQTTNGGRADVVVSYAEAPLTDRWPILLARFGIGAAVRRELEMSINSPTNRGESIDVLWRFAARRPAVSAVLALPRFASLPGIVTLSGLWDRQTYRAARVMDAPTSVETRRRGAIDWTDWVLPALRLGVGTGIDLFDGQRHFVSVRGEAESRLGHDHMALLADGARWTSVNDQPGFTEFGGALAFRSGVTPRKLTISGRFDVRRASEAAPLAIWPGAGEGPGRPLLLRAPRLVDEGYLSGEAFGRGLLHGTIEAEVQVMNRGLIRAGLAAFTDWAKPRDTVTTSGAAPSIFAIGVGVRLRGIGKTLIRGDLAIRPGHGGVVVSGGITPPWPH
ncbi:MAG: cysteine peptidase family C39 domain-containing protein, partial [Vicinamibacteria bacterium]